MPKYSRNREILDLSTKKERPVSPLPLNPAVEVEMCQEEHFAFPVPKVSCHYCTGSAPTARLQYEHGPYERLLEPTKPVQGVEVMWRPWENLYQNVPQTAGLVHVAGAGWIDAQIWALLKHCPDLYMIELVVSQRHRAVGWVPLLEKRGVGIQVRNRFKGGL